MTATTITTTVTTSVTLGSTYGSPLTILTGAGIAPTANGAVALTDSLANSVITNDGSVVGGVGAGGATFGTAGNGGAGLVFSGSTLLNDGTIAGGIGGSGDGTNAGAGAIGVSVASAATVTNTGTITGGNGGGGGEAGAEINLDDNPHIYYGVGGAGAFGIFMEAGGSLTNSGSIAGGNGGYGGLSGGNGADGVLISGGSVTNSGSILGGNAGSSAKAAPGSAGVGLSMSGGGSVTNSGLIHGGEGSGTTYRYTTASSGANGVDLVNSTLSNQYVIAGGTGGADRNDGTGGGGGIGIEMSGGSATNADLVEGGFGGLGSTGDSGGPGGAGGIGVVLENAATFTNTGTILGGKGGEGPSSFTAASGGTGVLVSRSSFINDGTIRGGASASLESGGTGGIGVSVLVNGSLTNAGTITGGSGSEEDYTVSTGGAGVLIDGGTLTTSGTITGGLGGFSQKDGTTGATGDAVQFGSAGGTLIVDPNAVFVGQVAGNSAASLQLGGSSAGTLTGLDTQITGFSTVTLDAGSVWTIDTTAAIAQATDFAGAGSSDTLSLSGGGTLTHATGFGTLALGGTSPFTLAASYGAGTAQVVVDGASLTIDSGVALRAPTSGATGLSVTASGSVLNQGSISGFSAGYSDGDGGSGGSGVTLSSGSLTNQASITGGGGGASGFGTGGAGGVGVSMSGGSLVNDGSITGGGGGHGYFFFPGGAGGAGVYLDGGVLTNAGTISGGAGGGSNYSSGGAGGDSVQFGSQAATLVVDPGAVFNGTVAANAGVDDTLELAGSTAGTLTGLGSQFTGFTTLINNGDWTLAGANASLAGTAALINNGQIILDPSSLTVGSVSGTGTTTIDAGSTLDVTGSISSGAVIDFAASGATLALGSPTQDAGTLGGFGVGDAIDFSKLTFQAGDSAGITGNTLQVSIDGSTYDLSVASGTPAAPYYDFSSDGAGGTLLQASEAPCYLRGTRILTERGAVAVEDLCVGDQVVTVTGTQPEAKPIVWLGHTRFDATRHPRPEQVWPIRVRQGAFGADLPVRDLLVSPGHSFYIEGVLIQAHNLVNGVTVVQDRTVTRSAYYHVELERHEIVLSEGVPAESYLDTGNRRGFSNGSAFHELHPDFTPRAWTDTCVPLVFSGPQLERARAALLQRAAELGYRIVAQDDLHIRADDTRYEPVREGARVEFELPEGCTSIVLRSRSFVPAQVDARSGDTRELGICVGRLWIDDSEVALENAEAVAADWHGHEIHPSGHRQRWTRPQVTLAAGTRRVSIDLAGRGYYWEVPVDEHPAPLEARA